MQTFVILEKTFRRDLIHFDAKCQDWQSHLGVFIYHLFSEKVSGRRCLPMQLSRWSDNCVPEAACELKRQMTTKALTSLASCLHVTTHSLSFECWLSLIVWTQPIRTKSLIAHRTRWANSHSLFSIKFRFCALYMASKLTPMLFLLFGVALYSRIFIIKRHCMLNSKPHNVCGLNKLHEYILFAYAYDTKAFGSVFALPSVDAFWLSLSIDLNCVPEGGQQIIVKLSI